MKIIVSDYEPIDFTTEVDGKMVAIKFQERYMQIDPRSDCQMVTTCYLRPLNGRRILITGVAVQSPGDRYDALQGKKIALHRAMAEFSWTHPPMYFWHIARKAIWMWQKQKETDQAVEQALRELDQYMAQREMERAQVNESPGN